MQNNYVILLPLDFSLSTEKLTFRLKAPFDRSLVSLQFLAFSKASLISSSHPPTGLSLECRAFPGVYHYSASGLFALLL